MKGFKHFFTLASLALCLAVMVFGVMAASQISFTVTSTISYTVEDVYVDIETRIYSSNITFKSDEELADAVKQMQQSDFNILNNINTLPDGSTINKVKLYNVGDDTDYRYKYRTTSGSENPPELNPALEYTTADKGTYTFFVVTKITNISTMPISAFVLSDEYKAPENSYTYKPTEYYSLSTKDSYAYVIFAMSLKDFTQSIPSSTFKYPVKITKDDASANFANFTAQTQSTANLLEKQMLPVTGQANPTRINVVDEIYSGVHTALLNFEYIPTSSQDITLNIMAHNVDGSIKTYGTDWAINLVVSYLVAGVKIYTYNDYMHLNADDTGLVPMTSFTATPNDDSSLSVTIPASYMTESNLRDGKFIFCIPSMFILSTGYYRISANVEGVTAINYKQTTSATSTIAPVGNISVVKPVADIAELESTNLPYSYFNAGLYNIPNDEDVVIELYTPDFYEAYLVYDNGTNNIYSDLNNHSGDNLKTAIEGYLELMITLDDVSPYGVIKSEQYMNSTRFNIPSSLITDGTFEFGILNIYSQAQSSAPFVTFESMFGELDESIEPPEELPEEPPDGMQYVADDGIIYTYQALYNDEWCVTGVDEENVDPIKNIKAGIEIYDENGELIYDIFPVTVIDEKAFNGHSEITSVAIADSIEEIGAHAFRDCTGLTSISIPSCVRHMAYGVFWGCNNIESVEIATDNQYYKVEGNCIIDIQDGVVHSGLKNSEIPTDSSITEINRCAFAGIDIESIVIPDNIVEIRREAFFWCRKLTSIAIGNGLSVVGECVLQGCSLLETVTVSQSNTHYYAENNCLIERSSKTIRWVSKNSTIPTSADITTIGSWAFASTQTHTHITIPANIVTIEESAFCGCTRLTTIYIPNTVETIHGQTWRIIGDGVDDFEFIGAFEKCSNDLIIYTNVASENDIPSGWEEEWNSNGKTLLDVVYGKNVEDLPNMINGNQIQSDGLIYELSNLTWSVVGYYEEKETMVVKETIQDLPVVGISENAFKNANFLKNITIPNSVVINQTAFVGCKNINSVTYETSNSATGAGSYTFKDGVLTVKEMAGTTSSQWYLDGLSPLVFSIEYDCTPTFFGYDMVTNMYNLDSLTIPRTVTNFYDSKEKYIDVTFKHNITITVEAGAWSSLWFEGCEYYEVSGLYCNGELCNTYYRSPNETSVFTYSTGVLEIVYCTRESCDVCYEEGHYIEEIQIGAIE